MDRHARNSNDDAQWIESTAVPTASQVFTRALVTFTLAVIGFLAFVLWFMDTPTGDPRTPWWPVLLGACAGVFVLLQRFLQAPRPRLNEQVDSVRLKEALRMASRTGIVPEDPVVRTAAGVTACYRIESAVGGVASAVGMSIVALVLRETSGP